ncbi:MAG: response regulator [Armatimonadetes bacterium]|nr:response regulator [Armatimonadota bacterium]
MTPPTILVIEDNPATRKIVRLALESAGCAVLEAPDGRTALELMDGQAADLALVDLVLPDIDGMELVYRLRSLPQADGMPILAFSAFHSKMEQARSQPNGFTGYIPKPVEPSRLVEVVRSYLAPPRLPPAQPGQSWHVLAVDDDPLQLKLLKIHLEQLGFRVSTAADGSEALQQARACPPDVLLSDVLMPRLDGFRLCQAVRQDPQLARLPVVLVSAAYTEEADRKLAESAGATALVLRTPDLQEVVAALLASLNRSPQPTRDHPAALPPEDYTHRVVRQLERQTATSGSLAERLFALEARLTMLARLGADLQNASAIEPILDQMLHRCLDAAGEGKGLAYLLGPCGEFSLRAELGYAGEPRERLEGFFGHAELLHRAVAAGEPVVAPSSLALADRVRGLMVRAGARSLLIIPLMSGQEPLGALALAFARRDLGEEQVALARSAGSQAGHAIHLTRTLSRLAESEARLAGIIGSALDAIITTDEQRRITLFNAAAEELFRCAASEALGQPIDRLIPGLRLNALEEASQACAGPRMAGPSRVLQGPMAARRADGEEFPTEATVSQIEVAGQKIHTVILREITQRLQAEAELKGVHQRLLQAEAEKKRFCRELIQAVTGGKLRLVDAAEMPACGELALCVPLESARDMAGLRQEIRSLAGLAGMPGNTVDDLVLASGEAIANALKYGVDGRCEVYLMSDRVVVQVTDHGKGIHTEDLPRAVLQPGFSTIASLGMGYTLMLALADRVWLATGELGTVVRLVKFISPPEREGCLPLLQWEPF